MTRVTTGEGTRPAVFRAVHAQAADAFTFLDGQDLYCVTDLSNVAPFLMSLVSDSDLWMFVSSNGSLTAGRVNEDRAIFPYETDDKLHAHREITGPITLLRVSLHARAAVVWQPFSSVPFSPQVRRKLYKSIRGDRVIFEEINEPLGLTFRYRWAAAGEWGFIRTCTLTNHDPLNAVDVELLDGLVNVLPAGVELRMQQRSSCLVNAYTQCEVDSPTGLGIFSMTSLIVDRAEPAESLHANVVWSHGLDASTILLSPDQLSSFRAGRKIRNETRLKGRRGAYLVSSHLCLPANGSRRWTIVADAHLDQVAVASLRAVLEDPIHLESRLARSLDAAERNLMALLASADGIQATADQATTVHHLANVLFNCMRGGVIANNGQILAADLDQFLRHRNRGVHHAQRRSLAELPARISERALLEWAERSADVNLIRVALEYLPITFSRRHGDPSRPWNRFSIRLRKEDGTPAMNYQGNWRDIFQNWEALAASFPAFLPNMVAKFVNASTADGFNPYRITRGGVEWEEPDSDDPWSNIGYWGDHQIIYLLRLLEALGRSSASELLKLLARPIFTYADVPYRLKPYPEILRDRWNTITFDAEHARRIDQRVRAMGSDGKLIAGRDGAICHVTFLEKLIVPMLSKLSNFVLGGGIWMNTQRPEWNDANNALVGNGLSMVTLCYLRRYAAFCADLLERASEVELDVSNEVVEWLERVAGVLERNQGLIESAELSGIDRKRLLDELAIPFSDYRERVYSHGFSGRRALPVRDVAAFFSRALRYLDYSIRANARGDGLYHSYNLLRLSGDEREVRIERLAEMLEGQVAVLSSHALSAIESVRVVESLFASRLYRADQKSFLLYPDRELPAFMEKNRLQSAAVEGDALLSTLLKAGDSSIIVRDAAGAIRFNAAFRHANDLAAALDRLRANPKWTTLVDQHRARVLAHYEAIFHHASFTGRSGAMYGYEGLGCIYWHMVSKLLLAVQECYGRALAANEPCAVIDSLAEQYYRIRAGLGFNKTVREYGAFPTDPYSHTPKHAGAQQPGMTGQVKEQILTRWGELGVIVEEGGLRFSPTLLRRGEFLADAMEWTYYDVAGREHKLPLAAGQIGFTFCQVPVVYELSPGESPINVTIKVTWDDQSESIVAGDRLGSEIAKSIFERTGRVARLVVTVSENGLR